MTQSLRYFRLWAVIGWSLVGLVVYLSLGPPLEGPEGFGLSDKAGHFLAYCVLMLWFSQLYIHRGRVVFGLAFLAMGVILEFLQNATNYRSFESLDIVANAAGVLLGWSLGATIFSGWLARAEVWLHAYRV